MPEDEAPVVSAHAQPAAAGAGTGPQNQDEQKETADGLEC